MGDTRKRWPSIDAQLADISQRLDSAAHRWDELGGRLDQEGAKAAADAVREFLRLLDTVPTVATAFEHLGSTFERECGHETEYARLRDKVRKVIERCESEALDKTPERSKPVRLRQSLLDETRFHSNPDGYAGQISARCKEWKLKTDERKNLVAFAFECQRVADIVRPILTIFDARQFLDFARDQLTVVELADFYMGMCGTHLRAIHEAVQIVRDEISRTPELTTVTRTLVDQFPATPRGDLGFVEHVAKEISDQAAFVKRQVYSDQSFNQAIDGIRVRIPEALMRVKSLEKWLPDHANPVSLVLQRELSLGTVVGLAERLLPLVDALRNATEEMWLNESSAGVIDGIGNPVATISVSGLKGSDKKRKRSTSPGDARVKVIGAFTKHHDYYDGRCGNYEPMGCTALAKAANVAKSTATEWFKEKFGSHLEYAAMCRRNKGRLDLVIKAANGDFSALDYAGMFPDEVRDDGE